MPLEELHDEINAIDAIYPGSVKEYTPQIYGISVPCHENLSIQMSFPSSYPDDKPNIIQAIINDSKKYKDGKYIEEITIEALDKLFIPGEVCLFELISELEILLEKYNDIEETKTKSDNDKELNTLNEQIQNIAIQPTPKDDNVKEIDILAGWIISDPIVDRGSTFIAYAREVHSIEEANEFLSLLISDKKIAKASHNISSWRIKKENGIQFQDCDDDGETAAGGRLLHLLTMMDVWNVMVVVSRWFGGTHIGPDRFKHINSAARDAIVKGKFSDANKESASNVKQKKKHK